MGSERVPALVESREGFKKRVGARIDNHISRIPDAIFRVEVNLRAVVRIGAKMQRLLGRVPAGGG